MTWNQNGPKTNEIAAPARSAMGFASVGGRLFVFGGFGTDSGVLLQ
jgi:hypothetical protein